MTASTDWASNTTGFAYDADGRLVEVLYPTGGQVDAFGYDRAGRMEAVTMTAGAGSLAEIAYTRDATGRPIGEDHTGLPGPDRAWGHDHLGRLTHQDATATWAYDDADNLTATSDGSVQVFDAANQLCAAAPTAGTCSAPASGATVFDYDDSGRRLSADPATGPVTSYGWDDADRLSTVDDGTTTWTHRWRPDGLLAGTDDSATVTGLVWSQHGGLPLVLAETTPAGARSWLYGPDGAAYAQIDADGTLSYLHHDQLGSTRLVTDPAGAVTATVTYDPYGAPAAATGALPRLGHAGGYTQPDGLIYLRARHYDPATGQFLSLDPLVVVTCQPYAYANNNPLAYTDPTGLFGFSDITDAVSDAVGGAAEVVRGAVSGAVDQASTFLYEHRDGIAAGVAIVGGMGCLLSTGGIGSAICVSGMVAGLELSWIDSTAEGDYSGFAQDVVLTLTFSGLGAWCSADEVTDLVMRAGGIAMDILLTGIEATGADRA